MEEKVRQVPHAHDEKNNKTELDTKYYGKPE
jgi:hypothetical protein